MKGIPGLLLGAVLVLSACDGGGGGSAPGPAAPVGPAGLVSLSVTPALIDLACGQGRVLVCMGTYSDGKKDRVPANWTSSAPDKVSVVAGGGSLSETTRIAWQGEGTATVSAECLGLAAEVQVSAGPETPWTLYGVDYSGGIYAYNSASTAAVLKYTTTTEPNPNAPEILMSGVTAMTCDADGSNLYYAQCLGTPTAQIHKLDTTSWQDTVVFTFAQSVAICALDHDSEGKLMALKQGWGMVRIDPATGDKEPVDVVSFEMEAVMTVGPDDAQYLSPIGLGITDFIYRQKDGAGAGWGTDSWIPADDENKGWAFCNGMAVNALGDCFAESGCRVYRFRDVNQDGDALDEGECTLFADINPQNLQLDGLNGIAVAADGTVLVCASKSVYLPWQVNPDLQGIWALKDLNGDGDAMDPGEKVHVSSFALGTSLLTGSGICLGRGW